MYCGFLKDTQEQVKHEADSLLIGEYTKHIRQGEIKGRREVNKRQRNKIETHVKMSQAMAMLWVATSSGSSKNSVLKM